MPHDAVRWINALFAPADLVEARVFADPEEDKGTLRPVAWFFRADEIEHQLDRMDGLNEKGYGIFCGVCPRDREAGTADAVTRANAVWLDLDDKDAGQPWDADTVTATMQGHRLPPPSMLVRSGHGMHVYWGLREPADAEAVETFLRTIAPRKPHARCRTIPEADPKSTDRARVMRVPGFLNQKDLRKGHSGIPVVVIASTGMTTPWDDLTACMDYTPEAAHEPLPTPDAPRPAARAPGSAPSHFDRAALWMQRRDPAVTGQGGDEHTFVTACELVRGFCLSDDEAMQLLREWNLRCLPPWSERALLGKVASARRNGNQRMGEKLDAPRPEPIGTCGYGFDASGRKRAALPEPDAPDDAGRLILANHDSRTVKDDDGNNKTILTARHIDCPTEETLAWFGADMGRIGQNPFYARPETWGRGEAVCFLGGPDALFGFLHHRCEEVRWKNSGLDVDGKCYVSQAQFYDHLAARLPRYGGITAYPFEPARPEMFTRWTPPEGYTPDGRHLDAFCDFFNPATPEDAGLLRAMILTLFWGGPPGARPLFIVAPQEEGRGQQGVGKTELCRSCAALVGGCMELDLPKRGAFGDGLAKQALEEVNLMYRVGYLDNVTGTIRDDTLTDLVTARTIAGRATYAKQAERCNLITWMISTNELSLSSDIASRTAIIRIAPSDRASRPNWRQEVAGFTAAHAAHIAADCMHVIRTAVHHPLGADIGRFSEWEQSVLACVPNAQAVMAYISAAQRINDADADEMGCLLEALAERHASPPGHTVELRIKDICDVFKEALGNDLSQAQMGRILRNALAKGQLHGLRRKHETKSGSPWLWDPYAYRQATGSTTDNPFTVEDASYVFT